MIANHHGQQLVDITKQTSFKRMINQISALLLVLMLVGPAAASAGRSMNVSFSGTAYGMDPVT